MDSEHIPHAVEVSSGKAAGWRSAVPVALGNARARLAAHDPGTLVALAVGAVAFALLYRLPLYTLVRDWWQIPDAGHGLLLGPLALYLAWRAGVRPGATSRPAWGLLLLLGAVTLRYLSGLAAEPFTMRVSLLGALAALTVYRWGFRQLPHWWLPGTLLALSIPLPAVLLTTVAFPLQFLASSLGAALLRWRHVPVELSGNIIQLPGYALFVTEACSGLRSLTALVALGVLMGGLWLRSPASRLLLVALTIPVGILINCFRVFLTGFLVYFVDPALGEGFMHYSEGWVLFVAAFLFVGAFALLLQKIEEVLKGRTVRPLKLSPEPG